MASLFDRLKKAAGGVGRQINPFDGGATYGHAAQQQPVQPAQGHHFPQFNNMGISASPRLNFTTPDQQLNASNAPYPDITKGLTFGNNRNPVGRGVPFPDVKTNPTQPPLKVPPGWTYGSVGGGLQGWRDEGGVPGILPGYVGGSAIGAVPQYVDPSLKRTLRSYF